MQVMILKFKNQVLDLYKSAFPGDSEEFAEKFINRYFEKNCRYNLVDSKVSSMLFLFDCTLHTEKKAYPASYLYAAATLPGMRGKGEMSRLIEMVKQEERLIVTRPADDSLFSFYQKFGFKTVFYFDEYVYSRVLTDAPKLEEISYEEYYEKREELLKDVWHLTLEETNDFAVSDMLLLGGEGICCAVDTSEDIPVVYEFLSKKDDGEEAVLNYIGKDTAVFRGKEPKKPFAMVWSCDENIELPDKMYMGLAME